MKVDPLEMIVGGERVRYWRYPRIRLSLARHIEQALDTYYRRSEITLQSNIYRPPLKWVGVRYHIQGWDSDILRDIIHILHQSDLTERGYFLYQSAKTSFWDVVFWSELDQI